MNPAKCTLNRAIKTRGVANYTIHSKNNENANMLTLGYDLEMWDGYGEKFPVATDISPSTNSHSLICGLSGGGKSFKLQHDMARLELLEQSHGGTMYFLNYKNDESMSYLQGCPRYYTYKKTIEGLDAVYDILQNRLAGDNDRRPVTLIWDEYVSNILALQEADKKLATTCMNRVSEILLMGRSLGIRLITATQRSDAAVYSTGARLNYGVVCILGGYIRSIYEMLLPDHMEQVREFVEKRPFSRGEGVCLLQGAELHFIKVPVVDTEHVKVLCIQALS